MSQTIHLHMSLPDSGADTAPPDWVHLTPASPFRGIDGRGPYEIADAEALMRTSLHAAGGKILLDETHATDLGAAVGGSARAVAWITDLQARPDGIYGRAEWTKFGRGLMGDRAYRGLSPALCVDPAASAQGRQVVTAIARASLTNRPNLSLTSLHQQQETRGMDLAKIRSALGLAADATEQAIEAAIVERAGAQLSLHHQVAEVAGADRTIAAADLITALRARIGAAAAGSAEMVALQAEVKKLREQRAVDEATRVVDEAARTRAIPAELRGQLITLHATQPQMVTTIIATLPDLKSGGLHLHQAPATAGVLSEDERRMVLGLGGDPAQLAAARKEAV